MPAGSLAYYPSSIMYVCVSAGCSHLQGFLATRWQTPARGFLRTIVTDPRQVRLNNLANTSHHIHALGQLLGAVEGSRSVVGRHDEEIDLDHMSFVE